METGKFKLIDIAYGIGIPIILAVLIYVLAMYVNPSGSQHVLGTTGIVGTWSLPAPPDSADFLVHFCRTGSPSGMMSRSDGVM